MIQSARRHQWRLFAMGFIAGILSLLANHQAFALFLYLSLDDLIARAPVILHVQIESVNRIIPDATCPAIVKSTVIQKLKGSMSVDPSKAFIFQGSESLKPGHVYILFARPIYDGGIYYAENFRQSSSDQTQRLVKCGPFQFQQEMAWEVSGESVAISHSSLTWPTTISLSEASAAASRQELFAYIEKSIAGASR